MNVMGFNHRLFNFSFIALLFVAILRTTDGGSITWFEPPPVETITDAGVIRTVKRNLTKGSEVQLSWNFSLTADLALSSVTVELESINTAVATYLHQFKTVSVEDGFQGRFNVTWIPNKLTLTILNVTTGEDDDLFICKVVSFDGSRTNTRGRRIEATVVDPPHITHISENQTVNQNDTVHLNCTADGKPRPIPTWRRLSDNSVVTMPLTITGKQDEGFYRCTANNDIGNASTAEVFITVQNYSPGDTTNLTSSNSIVVVNESFTLTCSAQANPPAKYRFYKNQVLSHVTSNGSSSFAYTTSVTERINQVSFNCTPFNDYGDGLTKVITVTVNFPPEIKYVSSSPGPYICEGSLVTLSCNATGSPTPNITWTRVADNGTDSEPLPAVDGTYVITNILRSSNGTYRCTAANGAGNVYRTVQVTVRYSPSVNRIVNSSSIVVEGSPFNMTCEASGDPKPENYTWITVETGQRHYQNILAFSNINRNDTGKYRCEADNPCGKGSREQSLDVLYKPSDVTLKTNTTENNNCSEPMWVNFNCVGSEANPGIENYQLYKNGIILRSGNSGTWTEKISIGGDYIFSCLALHRVENVSSPNVTVTLNVLSPIYVNVTSGSETLEERENVSLYCNVFGFPKPTITWSKAGVHEPVERGHWLNLTDTTRNEAGNYSCQASNTCGEKNSSMISIDVQYKPENVSLDVNISGKVCAGVMVKFTCTANANPAVNTYTLYENDVPFENMSTSGVIRRPLNTSGLVVYRCEAYNSVATGRSSDTNLTVEVAASATSISNTAGIKEGDNVTLLCQAGFGVPTPNYSWRSNHLNKSGAALPLPNISRNYTGNYTCIASNACGSDSETTFLDVQYKPENVSLNVNISSKVCAGVMVKFTCTANANPAVNPYTLYENNVTIEDMGTSGVKTRPLERGGHFIYRCEASNTVGPNRSSDTNLTVEVAASVLNVRNPINVTEGRNVTLSCDVSGFPLPNVSWVNTTNGEIMKLGAAWPLLNISRNYTGNYSCTASNACGNDSKATYINVQYSPSATSSGQTKEVELGKNFSYPCPVDGNPPPAITWFKGREQKLTFLYHGETLEIRESKLSDSGWYTCFANNSLGNTSATFKLEVDVVFPLKMKIDEKDCKEPRDLSEVETGFCPKVRTQAELLEGFKSVECKNFRCGSIIVDLVLRFSQSVNESNLISFLKTAAVQRKFGPFKVDPDSIRITGTEPSPQSTRTTKGTEPSTIGPHCKETVFKDKNCKTKVAIVIGIAIASVLVIAIVSGTTAWWVHRKRKCRKDRRTHSSECEEQLQQPEDNTYSQVNSGYAHSGPPSANGADGAGRQQAAPTYASVDKSKKKKKQQEEKPPEYATVDKSKKKKKDEKVDYTYAEVDMSKKSSKKQQPKNTDGLVYADLEDFQRPQMPPVSTSPAALPPVKRPPSYEGTQYADITEFLKGDAALPKKRNSQGMEMQPQASPPANGSSQSNEVKPQGAPPSNGNSQGNEVKPQGANKDESGVPPKESKL